MLAQLYAPKHAQNPHLQAFYSLASNHFEVQKMQTYDTTGANLAQNFQNQRSGITFVVLFSLALFLAYAVNNHLVTDAFAFTMSHLFDNFSIKSGSVFADIILLIFFCLAVFGLFCVFKFFLPLALTVLIIAVMAAVFLAPETTKQHTVKLKADDKFEQAYGG